MSGVEENRPISWLGIGLGAIFAFVAGVGLLITVGIKPNGPNVWWYSMTILIGYLLAEIFTFAYDRWKSGHKSELWVPFEFAVFFVVVLFGAVLGQGISNWAVNAFNTPDSLAYFVFVFLDFGLPMLMLLDFFERGKFRKVG